jgi:hypothetical protein
LVKIIALSEFERIGEEVAIGFIKVLSRHWPGVLKKTTKTSVKTDSVPAEAVTGHLPNTKQNKH